MIKRPGHAPEDMRDIFSYDVITDGIRIVVANEHIPLVETLAERHCGAHPRPSRVASVTVRVEKLDVGPGSVGVEIRRERQAKWPRCTSSILPRRGKPTQARPSECATRAA